jgi:phosphatidylinositol alpha-1,6-mannosyltransferase
MPKTLFITNDFGPRAGGIETFIIGLIERLPKNSVTVYTSSQGDTSAYDATWLNDFGVKVIRDRAKILLPSPRVARAVRTLVKKGEFGVACFGAALPLGIMAATLRRAGIPRVVSLSHGHEVWWAKVFPFNLAVRRVGQTLDAMSYLGEFTRRAISRSLTSQAQSAMVHIAPGIDTAHFSPVPESARLRQSLNLDDNKVVVSVGRLVHRKGQDRLIEALPEIKTKIPRAHLLLIGEGPYRAELESLVRKHHVENSVTFIGRLSYGDLPKYIGVGDVFAMPSRSRFFGLEVEGLGIVYLEASACALPVVAGNSGGAPDAVLEGETGLVVDGTNIKEIARAIISILEDPIMAKKMGERGREWTLEKWSWSLWSTKFSEFLFGISPKN